MDSKILFSMLTLALTTAACTPGKGLGDDDFMIGQPLKEMSNLSKADGTDSTNAAIFDETTKKIHVFDLAEMKRLRSHSPSNPEKKHMVLSHESGNYVIDFCEKGLTIFSANGLVQKDPVKFQGQPISAAFNSEQNLLVMYDDTNTIAMLQMNEQGVVIRQWVAGPKLLDEKTIRSGDLLSNGKLILGLSDSSIGIVDVDQSLSQKKWIFTDFDPAIGSPVSWIAPVADSTTQVFVRSGDHLAILDVQSKTKISTLDISSDESVSKLSKIATGHIITRLTNSHDQVRMYYVQNSAIEHRDLQKVDYRLLSSHLSLATDQWTIVEQSENYQTGYTDEATLGLDDYRYNRTLKSFRLSDMLALQKSAVPDQAQALLSPTYLFTLFPSELGYAVRTNFLTLEKKEAKFFNMEHL